MLVSAWLWKVVDSMDTCTYKTQAKPFFHESTVTMRASCICCKLLIFVTTVSNFKKQFQLTFSVKHFDHPQSTIETDAQLTKVH